MVHCGQRDNTSLAENKSKKARILFGLKVVIFQRVPWDLETEGIVYFLFTICIPKCSMYGIFTYKTG